MGEDQSGQDDINWSDEDEGGQNSHMSTNSDEENKRQESDKGTAFRLDAKDDEAINHEELKIDDRSNGAQLDPDKALDSVPSTSIVNNLSVRNKEQRAVEQVDIIIALVID